MSAVFFIEQAAGQDWNAFGIDKGLLLWVVLIALGLFILVTVTASFVAKRKMSQDGKPEEFTSGVSPENVSNEKETTDQK